MLPSWLTLLALTLPSSALAEVPLAVVPVDALRPRPEAPTDEPPVAVMIDQVWVRITPGDESLVELDLALTALDPGWVDLAVTGGALAVSEARLDGRPVALADRSGGARWLTAELSGSHRLVVRGSVATPAAGLDLPLPLASRARVELTEPGWDLEVEGGVPTANGAVLLAASERLAARWRPHAAPAPKPRVVTVQSASAVSFDESGLEGRATLRYRVAHGSLEQVSFRVGGAPDSVEVRGPAVRDVRRQGEVVTVSLARPMEGGFELDVSLRAPFPGGDDAHAAPLITPLEVFEHTGWLTVARADTAMLVPEAPSGLEAVPGSSLPDWATGLVPGTPVVSYALSGRSQALSYRLLSYDPVAAPPTVVDEARYQLATTEHGRALMKARYTVRNDRNQYLRLQPPPGFAVLGVRVAGQVRQPVADGDAIYIPLEKSVESLQGLISFPVEVFLLGEESPWERRGRRRLATPAVDAPVAYARWELWLPTDVEWQELNGLPKHVEDWTSSEHALEYGRAVRTEGDDDGNWDEAEGRELAEDRRATRNNRGRDGKKDKGGDGALMVYSASVSTLDEDLAEDASLELFNQAYQAYNANDFEVAQQLLQGALELDSSNASAQALLGNVAVVMGEAGGEGKADEAQARRVRELARARSVDDELEQSKQKKKAEEAIRSGDLELAERELARLEVMTRDLSRLEQSESVEQQMLLEETARQLEETRARRAEENAYKQQVAKEARAEAKVGSRTSSSSSSWSASAPAQKPAGGDSSLPFVSSVMDQAPPEEPERMDWSGLEGGSFFRIDPAVPAEGLPSFDQADGDRLAALEALMGSPEAPATAYPAIPEPYPEPSPEPLAYEDAWDEPEPMVEEEYYWEDVAVEYAVSAAPPAAYRASARAADAVGGVVRGVGRAVGKLGGRHAERDEVYYEAPPPKVAPAPTIVYRPRTEIDFEDMEIEGELIKPEGQLLMDRQRAAFQPLIDLRSDFDDEMSGSTGSLPGGALAGFDDAAAGWADAGPSEPVVMGFGVQAAPARPSPGAPEAPIVALDRVLGEMGQGLARVDAMAQAARSTGQLDRLQDLTEREASIVALHEVAANSAVAMLEAEQAGETERADHERRKVEVARAKVQQLVNESDAIARGEHSGSVAMEIDDTGVLASGAANLLDGIGGLIGAKGEQFGSGGLGSRGSGLGGGGTASGLGGLGTSGRGSGGSGYGAGAGDLTRSIDAPPPASTPAPVVAFGPPPADLADTEVYIVPSGATGARDPASAQAHGNVARGPVTTARRQETTVEPVTGLVALPAPPPTVGAAHLTINLPKAGERLAFEQLLVAENEPLTIDIRYRTRSRR